MHFLLGVVVLVTAAVVILRLAEVGLGWLPIVAIVRAIVQLALIALILQGALNAWWSVAAFIALMLTTASLTSLRRARDLPRGPVGAVVGVVVGALDPDSGDRKSTRLNSSHVAISYAVFCLKKKNNI